MAMNLTRRTFLKAASIAAASMRVNVRTSFYVGDTLLNFEHLAAPFAFVLIDWHGHPSRLCIDEGKSIAVTANGPNVIIPAEAVNSRDRKFA